LSPYRRRRRSGGADFCHDCHHGHIAHHDGIGKCFGERKFAGEWVDCQCPQFVKPPPEDEDA
jgi:hypothetical protein